MSRGEPGVASDVASDRAAAVPPAALRDAAAAPADRLAPGVSPGRAAPFPGELAGRAAPLAGELAGRAAPLAGELPQGYAGRRISFTAWGLAAVTGIGIWVLIFRLI